LKVDIQVETIRTQLLVIGSGPGGYVCAIRAAQLGINTIIVEAEKAGGTCLNVGCIPSKAIIHASEEFHKLVSMCKTDGDSSELGISATSASLDLIKTMHWKNGIVNRLNAGVSGLLKKANVQIIQGVARFRDGKTVIVNGNGEKQIHCENIVVATGSEPVDLPTLPFGDRILSSTTALSLTDIPDSLAVVGGGYIGLELGTSFAKFGSKVTVVENKQHILPQYDEQLTNPVKDRLAQLGVRVMTQTKALSYSESERELRVESASNDETGVSAEKVLITVGRRARMRGWGLEELSLTTEHGYIAIDQHCQTSMRGVYAIGDVTGEPMLAHRAMAQGELVARIIAGQPTSWDKQCIPSVCFTDPEIVSVGLLPSEAEATGESYSVSLFPFKANGRAMSLQREDGFIRVVTQKETNILLGIQAVGAGVSELSAAFSIAIEMGARSDDIAATIHAHPTLSEGLQEACMSAVGYGLHI